MKRCLTPVLAVLISVFLVIPVHAEWVQDAKGWRYRGEDGKWLTNTVTPDGCKVGQFGYWEGNDVFSDFKILGARVLKSQGDAVLDEEQGVYRVTVDAYDTVFLSEEEIRQIKKDDVIEFPELGIRATATTKASKSTVRAGSAKDTGPNKEIEEKKSLYRVRLIDSEGQNYILTSQRLRRTSADSSTTETLLRPVAQGIQILVPKKERSKKASGTSQYSATPALLQKGMLFTATIRGNMVLEIKDSTYNYDTTTAPEFTDEMVQEKIREAADETNIGPAEELDPEE
ncbi:MAG: hypothetical protein IJT43_09865 [Stomatobaculum sp.]|nr:hypothetical protein [Stomatobaculum sp.]